MTDPRFVVLESFSPDDLTVPNISRVLAGLKLDESGAAEPKVFFQIAGNQRHLGTLSEQATTVSWDEANPNLGKCSFCSDSSDIQAVVDSFGFEEVTLESIEEKLEIPVEQFCSGYKLSSGSVTVGACESCSNALLETTTKLQEQNQATTIPWSI